MSTLLREQAVLGRCLLDGICPNIRLEDWEIAAHRQIHAAMVALQDRGDAIDLVSVTDYLDASGRLREVGGASYVASLLEVSCLPEHMDHHERAIIDGARRRCLINVLCEYASHRKSLMSKPLEDWLPRLREAIDSFASGHPRSKDPEALASVVKRELSAIEERRKKGGGLVGITTGLSTLDRVTGGMIPGDMIIIAGRPGMGKTALAVQIAASAARTGHRVLIFSLEMPREQIAMRALAQEARVDIMSLRTGRLTDHEHSLVLKAAPMLSELDIVVDDSADLTDIDIVMRTRKHRPNLVVLDYLTLCRPMRREERRDLEVGYMSRTLKSLAREMSIPVVVLSQLNRALESRTNKRPMCSDLRDSGSIEQDADVILLLYRDEIYNPDTKDKGVAEIIIGKQRNGPTGFLRCYFDQASATFRPLVDDVSL